MKMDDVKKNVDRLWEKTKKDWEKVLDDTSKMIKKGESQLKDASERGMERLEEIKVIL
jgi:hypothetical protein